MNKVLCYLFSGGKHKLPIDLDGECHCSSCGQYLYTEYDFKASLEKSRKDSKLWWQK